MEDSRTRCHRDVYQDRQLNLKKEACDVSASGQDSDGVDEASYSMHFQVIRNWTACRLRFLASVRAGHDKVCIQGQDAWPNRRSQKEDADAERKCK